MRASELALKLCLGTALAAWGLAAGPAAVAQDAVSPEAVEDAGFEEVVVTARRRSERAQDVPIAMSVLSGNQLEAAGVDNIRSLYLQVPSLKIVAVNPRNIGMTIRGLGANLANEGLVNSVGVFVDGVYYARPGASAFGMVDIERVEVLRGPQGTLFGKNTTAGALNITTRLPSFEREGALQIDAGSYGYWKTAGTVSGALGETLAARLTFAMQDREGFIDNVATGETLNEFNDLTVRGQLLWEPSENLTLRFAADYSFENFRCCVDVIDSYQTTYQDGTVIPNNFAFRAGRLGYTPRPADPFARETDINDPQRIRMEQFGASTELNWNTGGGTLTSITAGRNWRFDPYNDLDLTGLGILAQGAYFSRARQFTQELRFANPSGGTFEYVIGAFYLYEKLHSDTLLAYGDDAGAWIVPALPVATANAAFAGVYQTGVGAAFTSSFSVFGSASWRATDALKLSAGLRYTHESKWGYFSQTGPLGGAPVAGLEAVIRSTIAAPYDSRLVAGFPQDYDEGNLSGTASITYVLTPDINIYASYARGYKSGGINFAIVPAGASNVIQPELADNYEIGFKSVLFDRRAVLNIAAFWTEVEDFQSTQLFLNPSTGAFTSYVTNVGELRSRGIEYDLSARVSDNLVLSASGAYTDAVSVSYPNAQCALVSAAARCDLSGRALPNVSKWALQFAADYEIPLSTGPGEMRLFGRFDTAYRSGFHSGASVYTYVPSYWVANASLGLRFGDGSTELAVWARNLFDEEYYLSKAPAVFNTGAIQAQLGDPRMFGVSLKTRF